MVEKETCTITKDGIADAARFEFSRGGEICREGWSRKMLEQ